MRRSPPPYRDPADDVVTWADRRRGLRTQADTDTDLAAAQAAASEDSLAHILSNPKIKGKITVRMLSDTAFVVENAAAEVQAIIGTQSNVAGTDANPIFLIGPNCTDIFTYTLKIFGGNGDIVAPNGFLYGKTHNFARWFSGAHHNSGATTLSTVGTTAWTAGSPVNDDDTSGTYESWARYDTSGVLNNAVGPNGPTVYRTGEQIEALFRIKTGSDITNVRYWVGLFDGDPSGSSTPNLNFAGFRFHAGTDTNWIAYTGDGAVRSQADTTIAVVANQTYYLRCRLLAAEADLIIGLPGINDGFVNGTWTKVITTNLPGPTVRLAPFVRCTNITTAGVRSLKFGFFNCTSR